MRILNVIIEEIKKIVEDRNQKLNSLNFTGKINACISKIQSGEIERCEKVTEIFSTAIMLTASDKERTISFVKSINKYLNHISRPHPNSKLTIKYLRLILQEYEKTKSASISYWKNIKENISK